MKTYTLKRAEVHDRAPTRGAIVINGETFCTLERPWLNNKPFMSCIPPGEYEVRWHKSPSKGECWKLHGVPNRSEILIHVGNSVDDTEGCILVGETHDYWGRIDETTGKSYNIPVVSQSRAALKRMSELLGVEPWKLKVENNG